MAEAPSKGSRGELPEGGLARVQEALALAWTYLDDEARGKLAALQDEDTLWALAVILVCWGGFQFTPLAWAVDAILAVVGAFAVTTDVIELLGGGADAVMANTPEEFDNGARRIAKGIVGLGVDVIAGLIGGTMFGLLRRAVRSAKGGGKTSSFFAAKKADPVLAKVGGKPGGKLTSVAADAAVGGAVAIGAVKAAPVVGQKWNDTKRALNLALPIVGGLLLVGGIWAYSSASKDGRR